MKIKVREFFYVSNILSISRVILVIPFSWLIMQNSAASIKWLYLFSALIIMTDYLDGYLARKLNQITDLGIVLDPIADKIVMAVSLILLIIYRNFPIPLVILLIYRDIMIIVLGWFTLRKLNKPVMANIYGKINTGVFAAAGFLSIIKVDNLFFTILVICSYFTIFISGISYGMVGAKLLYEKTWHKAVYWAGIFVLSVIVIYLSLSYQWL